MKRLLITLTILLFTVSYSWAIPPSPPSSSTGDMSTSDYSANGLSLIAAADYAAMKALLDLEIGTDVQAYSTILAGIAGVTPANNGLFGYNNVGTLGLYTTHQHDDSAAQFSHFELNTACTAASTPYACCSGEGTGTCNKGNVKMSQSSIDNGILVTVTPVATGNATLTMNTVGAGTYKFAFLETDNTFTGANTIGDGGDDQRIVSRINATNERWSGHTIYFAQCAASLAFGTPVYIQSTGKPAGADADAAATMPAIGLIVVASTDADTPCTVLTHGVITDTDWNFTTVGATIYTSETVGSVELDVANISDTNDVVQVLGIALHADTLFVNPSLVTIVLE